MASGSARRRLPLFVKLLGGATVGVIGTAGIIYVTRPTTLVEAAVSWKRRQAGLVRKTLVLDDGFSLSYAEKGSPSPNRPSLVLLHGFTGNLDATVPVTRLLPPDSHVIAVDAPAHGRSSAILEDDFKAQGMAERLKQFTSKIGLDKERFHLVGWALGGTIAGFYASRYPDDLRLLTIACPGMKCPRVAEPIQRVVDGEETVLLPQTAQGLQDMMDTLLEKKVTLPKLQLQYVFNERMKRREDHKKVLRYTVEELLSDDDNLYIREIANITTPTQLIWGENDGLIDVSGAELLSSRLGAACKRMDVVPCCGHTFYMEEPHTLSGLITAFHMDCRIHEHARWRAKGDQPRSTGDLQRPTSDLRRSTGNKQQSTETQLQSTDNQSQVTDELVQISKVEPVRFTVEQSRSASDELQSTRNQVCSENEQMRSPGNDHAATTDTQGLPVPDQSMNRQIEVSQIIAERSDHSEKSTVQAELPHDVTDGLKKNPASTQ